MSEHQMSSMDFNFALNQQLGDQFSSDGWSGVAPKFYKSDVSNIIKCIEINKSYDKDGFTCLLSVYSNFKFSNAPKGKIMHTYTQIFLVGLSPTEVTNTSYDWPLTDDSESNHQQFNLLWETITSKGAEFFNRFNEFPEPFLHLKPGDFEKGGVRLFDQYEVYSQIDFINFLKEIHWSLGQKETALDFSELAIKQFYKNTQGKSIMQDKAYRSTIEEYLRFLKLPTR